MSIEALNWAWNLAPVPYDQPNPDKPGRPNPACAAVLVGLANHADPDGTGAFPSVARLVRYTRLSERTVRGALDRLEADGIIRPCDPAVIAAKIKRADRHPKGYDLGLGLTRLDLTDDDIAQMSRQWPGLRQRVDAARRAAGIGVQPLHPAAARGAAAADDGVQPPQERGAAAAPEPSLTHPEGTTPPPTEVPPAASRRNSSGKTEVPDPFVVTEHLRAWAASSAPGVDIDAETLVFVDHHRGAGTRWKDWDRSWQAWIRRSAGRARGRVVGGHHTAGNTTTTEHDERRDAFQ